MLNGTAPLSSLFTGGMTGAISRYFVSINHTYYSQGEEDARLLGTATTCVNIGRVEFVTAMAMLHSGRDPDPDDLPKFLAMASSEFLKALGYDKQKADQIVHRERAIPLEASNSRIIPMYGGAAGTFYGKGMTPNQTREAYSQVASLSSRGQKVAECSYKKEGWITYDFWFGSVPTDYQQMVSNVENHPLRRLGRVSVDGCPPNLETAHELERAIDDGREVHFTGGTAPADNTALPAQPSDADGAARFQKYKSALSTLMDAQHYQTFLSILDEYDKWVQGGRKDSAVNRSFRAKQGALYNYYYSRCYPSKIDCPVAQDLLDVGKDLR
ncbi:MAG: hypothetical protein JO108_09940 [Acidobacteriaceae bacterium]|nr:hypothetical protein [Acidobacteriaceae bacterium]